MNETKILRSENGFILIEKAYLPNMQNIEEILSAILDIYKDFFGGVQRFSVVNDPTLDIPWTHKEINSIYIGCVYNRWCQIAYQFCHELCHLMIPKKVIRPLRWFEETICELASLFFMDRLSEYWELHSLLDTPCYSREITSYISSVKADFRRFNLTDLADPASDISLEFITENGEYHREENCFIALNLLPIFERHQELWKAVPYLCDVDLQDAPLLELLCNWKSKSPDHTWAGIDEITALFQIKPLSI